MELLQFCIGCMLTALQAFFGFFLIVVIGIIGYKITGNNKPIVRIYK